MCKVRPPLRSPSVCHVTLWLAIKHIYAHDFTNEYSSKVTRKHTRCVIKKKVTYTFWVTKSQFQVIKEKGLEFANPVHFSISKDINIAAFADL